MPTSPPSPSDAQLPPRLGGSACGGLEAEEPL